MENKPGKESGTDRGSSENIGQRVYLIAEQPADAGGEHQIDLGELWDLLWGKKWLILTITVLFFAVSLVYALTATEWYRSDVLLVPTDQGSRKNDIGGRLGGLGSLAGLAGIDLTETDSAESIAVLESRDFTREFIERYDLIPILLADEWDEAAGAWRAEDPSDWPDIRDAVKFFDEEVRSVSVEAETGLVTLAIEWPDPESAASWADALVTMLNEHMRQRALIEAQANVAYLEEQLETTNVAILRQSMGNILQSELEKLMLAKGNQEFAFRVLDSAQVPKDPVRPKKLLILVFGIILGAIAGVSYVLMRQVLAREVDGSSFG